MLFKLNNTFDTGNNSMPLIRINNHYNISNFYIIIKVVVVSFYLNSDLGNIFIMFCMNSKQSYHIIKKFIVKVPTSCICA